MACLTSVADEGCDKGRMALKQAHCATHSHLGQRLQLALFASHRFSNPAGDQRPAKQQAA